jgi:hypothetical protein
VPVFLSPFFHFTQVHLFVRRLLLLLSFSAELWRAAALNVICRRIQVTSFSLTALEEVRPLSIIHSFSHSLSFFSLLHSKFQRIRSISSSDDDENTLKEARGGKRERERECVSDRERTVVSCWISLFFFCVRVALLIYLSRFISIPCVCEKLAAKERNRRKKETERD